MKKVLVIILTTFAFLGCWQNSSKQKSEFYLVHGSETQSLENQFSSSEEIRIYAASILWKDFEANGFEQSQWLQIFSSKSAQSKTIENAMISSTRSSPKFRMIGTEDGGMRIEKIRGETITQGGYANYRSEKAVHFLLKYGPLNHDLIEGLWQFTQSSEAFHHPLDQAIPIN